MCTMKQEAVHYLHYKDLTLNQINEKKQLRPVTELDDYFMSAVQLQ